MGDLYLIYSKLGNYTRVHGIRETVAEAKGVRKKAVLDEASDYEAYVGKVPYFEIKSFLRETKIIKIKSDKQLKIDL